MCRCHVCPLFPAVAGLVPVVSLSRAPPATCAMHSQVSGYSVFVLRYVVATFLSAYFGPFASERGIGQTMQGVIFAAFPAGLTLTAAVAPRTILRVGIALSVTVGARCCAGQAPHPRTSWVGVRGARRDDRVVAKEYCRCYCTPCRG